MRLPSAPGVASVGLTNLPPVNLRSEVRGDAASYSRGVLSSPGSSASVPADAGSAGGAPSLFPLCAGSWRQLRDVRATRPTEGQRWSGFGAVSENH
jgi:hypothetical protein